MLKAIVATGLVVTLAGCAVAPGYDYGYAQPAYYYGYEPAYAPAYGGVDIGVWGGGGGHDYHGGHWRDGGHGGSWHGGGRGDVPHSGGHGGHGGGGHGGGGHGGR